MKKIKRFFRVIGAEIDYAFFEARTNYDILDHLACICALLFIITFIVWIVLKILGI